MPLRTEPTQAFEVLAYRPDVAAQVLGVSRATIYRMIAKGDLVPRKLGAATVIPRSDLVALLERLPHAAAAGQRPGRAVPD